VAGTNSGSTAKSTTDQDDDRTKGTEGPPPAIVGAPDLEVSYDSIEKESSPIGRGGDAVVYPARVHIDSDDQYLALKEPDQRGTLHKETVRRFLNEAGMWQQLADHDHIVDVVGWDSQPLPWIAMEYMDGGDLRPRLGSLPFDQAVWTALTITKAVRHAHNKGVRHYDLKPENVLFRSTAGGYWDVPKVADWGLAEQALQSGSGTDGMTPAYAAPEQLFDEYGDPDHRTDIYQLGLLCYELFTGQHPFGGDQTQVRSASTTPPSETNSAVPSDLDNVLAPALAVDPADRYEDVLDLRRELGRLM